MLDTTKTPQAIVKALDQYVIGQDEAKRIVAVAVYAHFRKIARSKQADAPVVKSNVLLIGPSGTGKTLLCETLSKILDVPFATAEATSLAQTQYVNEEIEAILQRLVDKAGGDVAKAGHGIVFIDEIDKLKGTGTPARTSGESVQHALLKIMEGAQVKVADGSYVDTTDILFVCGGAFDGLERIIRARSEKGGIGFGAEVSSKDNRKDNTKVLRDVQPEDLIKYGLIPEFVGRLPVVGTLHELDKPALIQILTQPRNAIVRQYQKLLEYENVKLKFTDDALEAIAESALKRKIGARGLRMIIEELMLDLMYNLPSQKKVRECVITREVVEAKDTPITLIEKAG